MIALNLGSGQRPFKDPWLNYDIQRKWEKPTLEAGCEWIYREDMEGIDKGSVDMVCLHHVLEHFGCGEADDMIKDCHRLLKSGGSLLVFVPDMRKLAQRWLLGQITDYIYFVNVYGAYMGDEADRHRWNYSFDSLKETLRNCGDWSEVKYFDWRDIMGADIAKDWWVLGMECVK